MTFVEMNMDANWVAALGQVAGAVSTVAAVLVAVRILATEQLERMRN
jgi:hypothetical protein